MAFAVFIDNTDPLQNDEEFLTLLEFVNKNQKIEQWKNPMEKIKDSFDNTLKYFVTSPNSVSIVPETKTIELKERLELKDPKLFHISYKILKWTPNSIPKSQIFQSDTKWILKADVPGLREKDILIQCQNQKLIICTIQRKIEDTFEGLAPELHSFVREYELPLEFLSNYKKMKKNMEDGVLTIEIAL